jgi:hypothetical protein
MLLVPVLMWVARYNQLHCGLQMVDTMAHWELSDSACPAILRASLHISEQSQLPVFFPKAFRVRLSEDSTRLSLIKMTKSSCMWINNCKKQSGVHENGEKTECAPNLKNTQKRTAGSTSNQTCGGGSRSQAL